MTLPPGTKRLLAAQFTLGVGSYVLLIGAGRTLDARGFAAFSVFWSLVFSFGLGLFGPLELMVLRLAALPRRSASEIEIPRLKRWYLWGGLVAGACAGIFLVRALGGTSDRPLALAASAFVYFQVLRTLAIQRGTAAGRGDLQRYARQVGVDGLARGMLSASLLGTMISVPWAWSWAVVLAGLAGAAAARGEAPGAVAQGVVSAPAADTRETLRDVAVLTAGTSLSVVLANSLPTLAVMLGEGTDALAGFSAAVIVARIPLFFAGVGQAVIVPAITTAADEPGRLRHIRSRVLAAVGVVSASIVVVVATAMGPVLAIAFPSTAPPTATATWMLAVSTGALMFALLGQGILIGQGRMSAVAGVWLAATAAAGAALALAPGDVIERVAVASAVSSIAACLVLLAFALVPAAAQKPVLATPEPPELATGTSDEL